MRVTVLAGVLVGALMLASCTTPNMTTNTMGTGQQTSNTPPRREAPVPPALRTPRQRSGVGWPDLGYRPHGQY
jgi:hypothetical protein